MNAVQMLERLVGFETVFDRPNRDLIEFVAGWFRRCGVEPVLLPGAGEGLLNLWRVSVRVAMAVSACPAIRTWCRPLARIGRPIRFGWPGAGIVCSGAAAPT